MLAECSLLPRPLKPRQACLSASSPARKGILCVLNSSQLLSTSKQLSYPAEEQYGRNPTSNLNISVLDVSNQNISNLDISNLNISNLNISNLNISNFEISNLNIFLFRTSLLIWTCMHYTKVKCCRVHSSSGTVQILELNIIVLL